MTPHPAQCRAVAQPLATTALRCRLQKPQNYGQAYCRKEDAVVELPTSLQHMPHSLGQRTSGASEQLMNIALPLVAPMESEEEHLPLENDKPSAMYFSPPHLTWGLELINSYTARKWKVSHEADAEENASGASGHKNSDSESRAPLRTGPQ